MTSRYAACSTAVTSSATTTAPDSARPADMTSAPMIAPTVYAAKNRPISGRPAPRSASTPCIFAEASTAPNPTP